jgi:hypothetical protein
MILSMHLTRTNKSYPEKIIVSLTSFSLPIGLLDHRPLFTLPFFTKPSLMVSASLINIFQIT